MPPLETERRVEQPEQLPMVGWYDPGQLMRTATQVAASTILGAHADYRLIEALVAPAAQFHDLSDAGTDGSFWLDYVADVGDGWNSTYAVASALAQPELPLEFDGQQHPTRRGNLLVFGGDEVYPTPSRTEYRRRLVTPYETALSHTDKPHPQLYAIPGNHDWYDSLASFTRQFVGRPWLGGWETGQVRSYFAIKLPRGWWLCGTDVQLGSDIDDPQVQYFREAASKMLPGDRIILCNAEPHWVYAQMYEKWNPDINENNLAFLQNEVFKNNKIAVYLAGDLHHYRRHEGPDGTQKITAGGGGAFLHPTHGPDVSLLDDGGFELKKSFPEPDISRRLCWRNLYFLALNPLFGVFTGALYLLTAWTAMTDLSGFGPGQSFEALSTAILAVLKSPLAGLWITTLILGFWLFTDTHSRKYRFIAGSTHAIGHLLCVFLVGWGLSRLGATCGLKLGEIGQLLFAGLIMFGAGWILGSMIMGLYLLVSLNRFDRHGNEAFSSLQIQDWKNFLRLKIDSEGTLTIYPVGIERVPRRWKPSGLAVGPKLISNDPKASRPTLIESPIACGK